MKVMKLSKEHFNMYNEYTLIINKIKREVNAIIKQQKIIEKRAKKASEEELLSIEKKDTEVDIVNKKKVKCWVLSIKGKKLLFVKDKKQYLQKYLKYR